MALLCATTVARPGLVNVARSVIIEPSSFALKVSGFGVDEETPNAVPARYQRQETRPSASVHAGISSTCRVAPTWPVPLTTTSYGSFSTAIAHRLACDDKTTQVTMSC